ncbi:MAG TPA: DUF2339 domain-containing protein [Flavobacterium sp.]|nr:DUF2339 domain-containing protein [Flavobacterium sp.]
MEANDQKINELLQKLEELSLKHEYFSQEIKNLRSEVQRLQAENIFSKTNEEVISSEPIIPIPKPEVSVKTPIISETMLIKEPKQPSDLEKIIGESWMNKIGMLILIIGVAIGAKYSIENNLISPLTRIILGYLSGIILLGFGMKLKTKFENYSAVLVSGAMAIFYFITYFAYDFYGLISQIPAFILMVIFTIFTVFAAIKYNRSVIAHIGLVGAYAVPFLLSNKTGNVTTLFTYLTIINFGILVISVKKYWKSLYYASFIFTWLIFAFWNFDSHFVDDSPIKIIGLGFATIFFLMFYAVSITNRIIQQEKLTKPDIILLLLNAFIYFGFGYGIMENRKTEPYLGLFTLFNAVLHFIVGYLIKRKKIADKNLFYLVLGLVFTFITIAIPVQLDGNWVTLLWLALAVLLFWIGRTKQVVIYERISYVLLLLAFFSLVHDWSNYSYSTNHAFFNVTFLTSLLATVGYGYVTYLGRNKTYLLSENQDRLAHLMTIVIPVLLGIVSYFTFRNEINLYFENWFDRTSIRSENKENPSDYFSYYNYQILTLKSVFIIGYSLVFFGIMSFLNVLKIQNKVLGIVAIACTLIALIVSQTAGLYLLGELREAYIERVSSKYFEIGFGYVLVRYVFFACVVLAIYSLFKYVQQQFMNPLSKQLQFLAEFVLYAAILCFLSNELITWLDLAGNKSVFKLGLSILWGAYSFVLIYLGIYKRRKYLRIGAISLFAVTLLKLFFYDIAQLNTISKTIVFISLGVLLLLISFLYNKFKDKISEDEKVD